MNKRTKPLRDKRNRIKSGSSPHFLFGGVVLESWKVDGNKVLRRLTGKESPKFTVDVIIKTIPKP